MPLCTKIASAINTPFVAKFVVPPATTALANVISPGNTIDWGDGSPVTILPAGIQAHSFTEGTYLVKISGGTGIQFSGQNFVEVVDFGTYPVSHFRFSVSDTPSAIEQVSYNLVTVPSSLPATVTSLDSMFRFCNAFTGAGIGGWDTSNVTSMKTVFHGAFAFNADISGWDVSGVTDMFGMFNTTPFNQDISGWNVSSVTDMSLMFSLTASFNQPLDSWDVSSVTAMRGMFGFSGYNQPLNSWNVASVTTMEEMFVAAPAFNQSLSAWDVASVTNMKQMFNSATVFNQDLSVWCVSGVVDHTDFDTGATAWSLPKPNFASPPC